MTSRLHDFVDSLDSSPNAISVRALALSSVVFDCGEIFSIPESRFEDWEILRPPFPVTCLEFEAQNVSSGLAMIVLVEDIGLDNGFRLSFATKSRLTREWNHSLPITVTYSDGRFAVKTNALQLAAINASQRVDVMRCFALCANVFQVLRCSNVSTEDNIPPLKLNKKRSAKGRCPLFTFKTLICNVPNQQTKNNHQGGTHVSPRVHLRRGHIRTIQTGVTVWVQSCVVGSKHGLVTKDYALRVLP
jgi:hypothetical protein